MSPLQVLHEDLGNNAIIITVIGQMDESNVDAIAPQIYAYIDAVKSEGSVILNFAGLEYMNSKSIGYTTDFYNKMSEKNGQLIIAEAQEQIVDILTVVGLTQVIPFVETVTEAKAMIDVTIDTEQVEEKTETEIEDAKEKTAPMIDLHAEREKLKNNKPTEAIITENIIEEAVTEIEQNTPKEPEEKIEDTMEQELLEDTVEEQNLENNIVAEQALEEKEELSAETKETVAPIIPETRSVPTPKQEEEENEFPILTIALIGTIIAILVGIFI